MERRNHGPSPVIMVRFSGNPAGSKRRKPVRATGLVRGPDAPKLTLLQGEGHGPAPLHAMEGMISPVRAQAVRTEWGDDLDDELLDLPNPHGAQTHLEAAIALLRRAAQATTVSERGDATLVAIEHASRSFGELFDREVAKKLLRDIADSL